MKVALVVASREPDAGMLAVLRLTGYAVRFERSIAAARAALEEITPQLAFIGDIALPQDTEALYAELKAVCPQVLVAATDKAAVVLADRLGLLVRRETVPSV
jgi:hypothetical protein